MNGKRMIVLKVSMSRHCYGNIGHTFKLIQAHEMPLQSLHRECSQANPGLYHSRSRLFISFGWLVQISIQYPKPIWCEFDTSLGWESFFKTSSSCHAGICCLMVCFYSVYHIASESWITSSLRLLSVLLFISFFYLSMKNCFHCHISEIFFKVDTGLLQFALHFENFVLLLLLLLHGW